MRFDDPWWLLAFALLPIWLLAQRNRNRTALAYSDVSLLTAPMAKSLRLRFSWLPSALWFLGLSAIMVALARPQLADPDAVHQVRGRAVSIVLDVSGSMAKTMSVSDGAKTTRLDKAKSLIAELLKAADSQHPSDEFGLTVFAAEPRTLSPTTTEREFVRGVLEQARIDQRDNRTEIGAGIALGLDLVRTRPDGESALLLLTDGAQRVEGGIGPFGGARLAEALGIPIVIVHFADDLEEAPDRQKLAKTAEISGGRLLHWPETTPSAIFDALPPPKPMTSSVVVWRDVFLIWIAAGIGSLLGSLALRATVFRITPLDD